MSCTTEIVCILDLSRVGRFGSVESVLQPPRMSRLRCHCVHLPARVSIIATLKGGLRKEANLGALERVNDAAFADIQKPARLTMMFGPYTWRKRRCTGVYQRRDSRTGAIPRSGRETSRSWTEVLQVCLGILAWHQVCLRIREREGARRQTARTDLVEHKHDAFPPPCAYAPPPAPSSCRSRQTGSPAQRARRSASQRKLLAMRLRERRLRSHRRVFLWWRLSGRG